MKRQILTATLLIAAATCVVTATCPLAETDTTTTSSSKTTQSPENGGKKELLMHNGHQICISVNAVQAHLKHGDTDLGPCSAPNKS